MEAQWERPTLGGHTVLLSSVAVALSSVLTIGLAAPSALIGEVVPLTIRRTASFLGALVGFLLLLAGLELRQGFRAAWYATTASRPRRRLPNCARPAGASLSGRPRTRKPFGGRASSARAVLAATNSDAKDVFSIPTARELDPNIRIVAAATDRENVSKLRRAGADTVINPAVIGGRLLVRSALGERGTEDLADPIVSEDDLR